MTDYMPRSTLGRLKLLTRQEREFPHLVAHMDYLLDADIGAGQIPYVSSIGKALKAIAPAPAPDSHIKDGSFRFK